MVRWASGVNKKIYRQTSWDWSVGTIADETRCGIKKVREGHTFTPNRYSVVMRFSLSEYNDFKNWFDNTLRRGAKSFMFPVIDSNDSTIEREYRFVPSSTLKINNVGGQIIEVSMDWEEV